METSKQPLRIENGRFMRGDVEVPTEIGNAEQIALLKSIECKAAEAETNGIVCSFEARNIRFESVVAFDCVCGCEVEDDTTHRYADIDDIENCGDDWKGETVACPSCGRKYKIDNLGFAQWVNPRI